jgi:hypothetical protein
VVSRTLDGELVRKKLKLHRLKPVVSRVQGALVVAEMLKLHRLKLVVSRNLWRY